MRTFANTYEATGSVTLYGSKFLENKDIAAGDFAFQLMDESNPVLFRRFLKIQKDSLIISLSGPSPLA